MERRVTITGTYCRGNGYVSAKWEQICRDHEEEFPQIRRCHAGTFNIRLAAAYMPPGEEEYRQRARKRGQPVGRYADGNHLSPRAKVVTMNGKPAEAWIYRGGHPVTSLELVSACALADYFSLHDGDTITATIVEFPVESAPDMPGAPPTNPGRTVPLSQ